MKHVTIQVMHVTADTGASTIVSLEEVNRDALEVCVNLIGDVLAGKRAAFPRGVKCSISGSASGDMFSAELYHSDYPFCLVEVTVHPSEFEGGHAKSVSKLDGVKRLQDMLGESVTQETKDDIILFGDIGRTIAWAWLIHEGYIDSGQ